MLAVGVLLIFLLILYVLGYGSGELGFNITFIYLVFIAASVVLLARNFGRTVPAEAEARIVSELRCPSCGFTLQKTFTNGDYISKKDQACPKDGTQTMIQKIFVENSKPA